MADEIQRLPEQDNIRGLIWALGVIMDARFQSFRLGTPYEHVRHSDIRFFVMAARKTQTISQLAREMHVTRQAAQITVQRLVDLGVVELGAVAGNRRDKQVNITPRGRMAGATAANQSLLVENEFAAVVGVESLAQLRESLSKLVQAFGKDVPKAATI